VRRKTVWISAATVMALPSLAQAAPPSADKPAPSGADKPHAVEGVVVTGAAQQGLRTAIDRRSYSLAADLQATTGSVADALRNIPAVEVGAQGDITLRGDANVTIMIDGKPSGMFRGESRANALQQLPADQFERVEVITNPSAAFDPNGSAGIINLISKKGRGAGASGSVRANIGDAGRKNASASGTYNSDRLTLNGDAALRHYTQKFELVNHRASLDAATGRFVDGFSVSQGLSNVDSGTLRAAIDYDLDPRTRLGGELRYFKLDVASRPHESIETDGSGGGPAQLTTRTGHLKFGVTDTEASGSFRRAFAGDGHELTIHLSHEEIGDLSRRPYVYLDEPPPPAGAFQAFLFDQQQAKTELKAEYRRPLSGEAKLAAGYQLQVDDNDYDNRGLAGSGPGAATGVPSLTNRFRYGQTVNSLYGTYERPFGRLTVLGGFRAETVQVKTEQVTLSRTDHNDYARAYPSLHLSYDLGHSQQLTASYTQRVQRPDPNDLNPFRTYGEALVVTQGDPGLKPQEARAYEAGWQYKNGQTYYLATAYFRDNKDATTDLVQDLGGGMLLRTKANLGRRRDGGLELTANGRLTAQLTYNISGNVYWTEIDATGLGVPKDRSATAFGGRGNLNWQATPQDVFQVNVSANARRLLPQGYREPIYALNLGYRHKVDEKLSAVVTVQDLFLSQRGHEIFETPVLRQRADRSFDSRVVFVGLTYAFGATKRPKEPGFDFGGGGTSPP
jgi:outer membrane receptor protein involved in Fe transport